MRPSPLLFFNELLVWGKDGFNDKGLGTKNKCAPCFPIAVKANYTRAVQQEWRLETFLDGD